MVYILLHDKIVYLTKKSNNIFQLQMTVSFETRNIQSELCNKLFNASHVSLLLKNTIPSKHKHIQPFPVKLHKNAN